MPPGAIASPRWGGGASGHHSASGFPVRVLSPPYLETLHHGNEVLAVSPEDRRGKRGPSQIAKPVSTCAESPPEAALNV